MYNVNSRPRKRVVRTRLRSGFRNGYQKISRGCTISERMLAAKAYATVLMKLKVLYEMDWVGLALCPDCHLGDRSGVHGVGWPHLSFSLDLFLPDVSPARLHELPF